MAELTTQERLQPSLLDRLTDDDPGRSDESREARVISANRLRDCVTRDLAWLLNCVQLEATHDLELYPYARQSVLNFGIPDLTGLEVARIKPEDLRSRLREAILRYEPRLTADTLHVDVVVDGERMSRTTLQFRIDSEMWAQPIPQNLYLKTEVDLQTGSVRVRDAGG